jgi:predicted phage terminase large subunit-like protein
MPQVSFDEYRVLLRNDLMSFIERSFYELNPQANFIAGEYIELLAATLEKCCTGKTKRLIINLPPRTLKSHAASVAFPAWLLGHDPSMQIICASYGQDLADKHARDCRTLMSSPFYRGLFPQTALSPVKSSVDDFLTTAQGVRMSTSVGGVLTGRGAGIIVLDDVMKPEDAMSEARRKTINEWYRTSLLSRLNSKADGVIIIVMQRLHQDDLVGNVLDSGEAWEVLSLPAIALQDEFHQYESVFGPKAFARKEGEALHPERDSVETYLKIRESVGEYNFQSQYQQSPMSREGGIVKREWLKFYEPGKFPSDFEWTIQSWDTACKTGDSNDFSVCTTWKLVGMQYFLIDVFRKRLTYPELKRCAIELFSKYRPTEVVIEDQASGTALIQELQDGGIYNIERYKPAPGSDKLTRFAAQSIKFENGKVFLPKDAPWLEEYIREITGFPGTKHDDQVDSTSQALESLARRAQSVAVFQGLERFYSRRYPIEYGG